MKPELTVTNYREELPGSKNIALFDIEWPASYGMIFRNWRLFRTKKGHLMVSGPAFGVEKDGEKKFFPYIEFSKEKGLDWQKAILALITPYLRQHEVPRTY